MKLPQKKWKTVPAKQHHEKYKHPKHSARNTKASLETGWDSPLRWFSADWQLRHLQSTQREAGNLRNIPCNENPNNMTSGNWSNSWSGLRHKLAPRKWENDDDTAGSLFSFLPPHHFHSCASVSYYSRWHCSKKARASSGVKNPSSCRALQHMHQLFCHQEQSSLYCYFEVRVWATPHSSSCQYLSQQPPL